MEENNIKESTTNQVKLSEYLPNKIKEGKPFFSFEYFPAKTEDGKLINKKKESDFFFVHLKKREKQKNNNFFL